MSKDARIIRPKTKTARAQIDGLAGVVKVDQLASMLNGDWDTKRLAQARRVVTRGEIDRLARGLVALHKPATVDWAAKFGLSGKEASAQSSGVTTAPAGVTPNEICQSCGIAVSAKVAQYSRDYAERFGGRILCFNCQRRHR